MTQAEKTQQMMVNVKNAVDILHEMTKNGINGPLKGCLKPIERVVLAILVNDGVVEKAPSDVKGIYHYTWKASMAPTNLFYSRMVERYREYFGKSKRKPVPEEPVAAEKGTVPPLRKATIHDYTDQELWDELKARGYDVADGRLCRVTYLD